VGNEPERWAAIVTASVPPTGHLALDLISWEQMHRSWYSYLFQLPVAEALLKRDDFRLIERLWAEWSPGYDAAADLAHVQQALARPRNLAAAVGYYRATPTELRSPSAAGGLSEDVPLLYLHGQRDGCIGVDVLDLAEPFFPANAVIEVIENAGHFLHLERPEVFEERVLRFVESGPAPGSTGQERV
jgi:pimeloyl-ACP methyl ester carboxylesterase